MRKEGLYCPRGDFYIDPRMSVGRAIITHGHSDHLTKGHKRYLISKASERILQHRLGPDTKYQTLDYGHDLSVNGVRISLHPAGHILGSAQVRLEWNGYTAVVTGDCKLEVDESCEAAEVLSCDHLVVESTFALPVFVWRRQELVFDEMARWCERCIERSVRPVLLCYSLGKAQRVLAGLRALAPLNVHDAVRPFVEIYEDGGIDMPLIAPVAHSPRPTIVPPGGEDWLAQWGPYQTAMVSGWTSIGPRARRPGFPLSDHVDWPGVSELVEGSKAESVWFVHGFSAEAARWYGERGLSTQAF